MPLEKLTAARWKKELDFRSAELGKIEGVLADGRPRVVTVKVNGELEVFEIDVPAGVAVLVNRNNRERTERNRTFVNVQADLLSLLKKSGRKTARGVGELYAVDKRGKPLPFNTVMSIVRKRLPPRTTETLEERRFIIDRQERARLAVLDIFEVDGEQLWPKMPYADRFTLLWTLFKGGKYVHPVVGKTGVHEADPVREMWKKHVLEENYEGLVLRTNGAVKVKPVHTVDVVVIGFAEGRGKAAGGVGVLMAAFRDSHGRFLEAGGVGTGFTDEERKAWLEKLKPLRTGQRYGHTAREAPIEMVAPVHVIEAATQIFNKTDVKAWDWSPRSRKWFTGRRVPGVKLQGPARFVRERPDKTISPNDLRLEQVPGWVTKVKVGNTEYPAHDVPIPSLALNGTGFGAALEGMRPDLARFSGRLVPKVPADYLDDVIQETYVRALRAWEHGERRDPDQPPESGVPKVGERIGPWLFAIFANAWRDIQRKVARRSGPPRPVGERAEKAYEARFREAKAALEPAAS